MLPEIDYTKLPLQALYSIAEKIDRDLYPERASEIDRLIEEKEQIESYNQLTNESNETKIMAVDNRATRLHRLLAAIIDAIVLAIANIPFVMYVGLETLVEPTAFITMMGFAYGFTIMLIVNGYLLYEYGQTIGKRVMYIRIEDLNGNKASFKQIILKRNLPMSLCALIPMVGQFIAGLVNPIFIFGAERKCLHDYIAKTQVCYTDS